MHTERKIPDVVPAERCLPGATAGALNTYSSKKQREIMSQQEYQPNYSSFHLYTGVNLSQNLSPQSEVPRATLHKLPVFMHADVTGTLRHTAWIFVAPLNMKECYSF